MDINEINDKYIQVDSFRVRYRILGEGNITIMLIHGIGGYIEGWADTPALISKLHKVVIVDLVGHGLSDKPDINYSIDMFTEFIVSFMNVLNIKNTVLVGHSLGGAICINLAIKYPDRVKSLILVNSAGIIIPFGIRLGSFGMLKKINLKTPRSMLKILSRNSIFDRKLMTKEWLDEAHKFANIEGSYRVMFSIINSNMGLLGLNKEIKSRFCSSLTNLKLPVLIICAANDRTVPNANSYHLHSLIPHSILIKYEKCGHLLPYEYTDKLAEDIIQFLSTIT